MAPGWLRIGPELLEHLQQFLLALFAHHLSMAGRRQHYLPRFLQRAFRYRTSGEQDYVYSHEARRSYSPSTMGLGQERDFYGHSDQSAADENITKGEGRLAKIVNDLKEGTAAVSQEDCALLVAALSVRTKAMRKAMGDLVKVLASSMSEAFEKHGLLRREIETFWSDRGKLEALVDDEVRKHPGLNREKRFKMKALVKQRWVAQKIEVSRQMHADGVELARQFFERMDREGAEVADRAFQKVFEQDPSIPDRVNTLRSFRFSVLNADQGEFVLGDCASAGVRSDGQVRLAVGDIKEDLPLEYIFLPISPTRCLVGSRNGAPPKYSVAEINRFSASLSHRFFISCSAQIEGLDELKDLIGSADPMASQADVESLMHSLELEKAPGHS
jgi:hypothetical protein